MGRSVVQSRFEIPGDTRNRLMVELPWLYDAGCGDFGWRKCWRSTRSVSVVNHLMPFCLWRLVTGSLISMHNSTAFPYLCQSLTSRMRSVRNHSHGSGWE